MHLHGYFKEWRKNPHWSFSCCLALLLPLISLPGDVSGLIETNIANTQLDTGQFELETVVGAVKDSGVIDVNLDDEEQDDDNPSELEEEDCKDAQLQTRDVEMPTIFGAEEDSGTTEGTLENGDQGEVICHNELFNNRNCHQTTQTELLGNISIKDVGDEEPVKE